MVFSFYDVIFGLSLIYRPQCPSCWEPVLKTQQNRNSPGPAKCHSVFLTGKTHGRGVNQRHAILHVLGDNFVEELLVAVLKTQKVNVAAEVVFIVLQVLHAPKLLYIDGFHGRREQAMNAKQLPFSKAKGRALRVQK